MIMGRKTFESIGRPLPGRRNLVVTRNHAFQADGIEVFDSLEAALEAVEQAPEVMIIGGGSIYQTSLALASRLYLTTVAATLEGDTYFPELGPDWRVTQETHVERDEKNHYAMTFRILQRITTV